MESATVTKGNAQMTWTATPEGFTRPVLLRRSVDRYGFVRFHYFGSALRWLPITAAAALAAK